MKPRQQIDELIRQAETIALAEIERMARAIMRKRPNLDEFVMGMGTAFFTTKDDENIALYDRKYSDKLNEFINDMDEWFGVSGTPMRFTVDGPVVTDW